MLGGSINEDFVPGKIGKEINMRVEGTEC